MTYRTLLSSALYTSLAIGALGVAFSAFADEDTMESHEDFTLIHAGHVMTVPGERVLSDHTIIIHDG